METDCLLDVERIQIMLRLTSLGNTQLFLQNRKNLNMLKYSYFKPDEVFFATKNWISVEHLKYSHILIVWNTVKKGQELEGWFILRGIQMFDVWFKTSYFLYKVNFISNTYLKNNICDSTAIKVHHIYGKTNRTEPGKR